MIMKHTKGCTLIYAIAFLIIGLGCIGVSIFHIATLKPDIVILGYITLALILIFASVFKFLDYFRQRYITDDAIGEIYKYKVDVKIDEILDNYTEEEISKMAKDKLIPVFAEHIDLLLKYVEETEQALKMACKELENVEVFNKEFMECDSFYDYFKTKAKEKKSE